MDDRRTVLGLLLVGLGLVWLLVAATDLDGVIIFPAVGLALLVGYLATASYALLVAGSIVTGLGIGIAVEVHSGPSAAPVLGLGLGFVSIAVLDVLRGSRRPAWWWPLIPGGLFTVVGGTRLAVAASLGAYVLPAVLVGLGLTLLLRRPKRGSATDPGPGGPSTSPPASPASSSPPASPSSPPASPPASPASPTPPPPPGGDSTSRGG